MWSFSIYAKHSHKQLICCTPTRVLGWRFYISNINNILEYLLLGIISKNFLKKRSI